MPVCTNCGSTTTKFRLQRGRYYERWYHNKTENETLCQKCYTKLVDVPKYAEKNRRKIITYAGKQIKLSFNIRNYRCSECNTTDNNKRYDLHHDYYIPIIPWLFTRELCLSCHLKQGWNDSLYTYNQYSLYQRVRK